MGAVYATFFQDKSGAFGLEKCSEATHKRELCGAPRSTTAV
ncbi:MAG TPA: hypothetical protein PLH65_00020 [bacterium]|nr:hypothetical protein [bacterium]